MGAKTLEPLAVVPAKSAKLGYMIHDAERSLDVEPHMGLGHLQKYMAERAALVSAHHHRELAAAQARTGHPSWLQQRCTEPRCNSSAMSLFAAPFLPLKLDHFAATDEQARSHSAIATCLNCEQTP
jgi:hypothetical protein